MHRTRKREATKPAAANLLHQHARRPPCLPSANTRSARLGDGNARVPEDLRHDIL
jgi:hypothetical protein